MEDENDKPAPVAVGNAVAVTDRRMANLKQWKPGQSGNPMGGAGKLARQLRMYIAGADGELTREDIDAIRQLAATARSEFVKLQALTWLAEQVVGKSTQPLALEDDEGNKVRVGIVILPSERSDDE